MKWWIWAPLVLQPQPFCQCNKNNNNQHLTWVDENHQSRRNNILNRIQICHRSYWGKKIINKRSRANYQYFKKSGKAINCCEFLSCYKSSKGIRCLSCFCSICLTQLTSLGRWAERQDRRQEPSLTPAVVERARVFHVPRHSHEYLHPHASTLRHVCTHTRKHSQAHLFIPANCQHLSNDEYSQPPPPHPPPTIFVYLLISYFPAKTFPAPRISSEALCSKKKQIR